MAYNKNNRWKDKKETQPEEPYPLVIQATGVSEEDYAVLKQMIFPEAKDPAVIALAVNYCKSRKLDIMKKPVHIVPIWDSKLGRMKETVWPSIYEHRSTALRTQIYVGKDEPEYGPTITKTFKPSKKSKKQQDDTGAWIDTPISSVKVSFPEWCKITVYKMIGKEKAAFSSKIFWIEAAVMKDGIPNSMWSKRPHGQLAKCVEAEALRSAFPDDLGGMMTAEEMEGRAINEDMVDVTPRAKPKQDDNAAFAARVQKNAKKAAATVIQGSSTQGKAESSDLPMEWDGDIISAEGNKIEMESEEKAISELKSILRRSELTPEDKLDIISANIGFINYLVENEKGHVVQELHDIAKGESDASKN